MIQFKQLFSAGASFAMCLKKEVYRLQDKRIEAFSAKLQAGLVSPTMLPSDLRMQSIAKAAEALCRTDCREIIKSPLFVKHRRAWHASDVGAYFTETLGNDYCILFQEYEIFQNESLAAKWWVGSSNSLYNVEILRPNSSWMLKLVHSARALSRVRAH